MGASCSKRQKEPSVADDGENWDAIQPLPDVPSNFPTSGRNLPEVGKTKQAKNPKIGETEEKVFPDEDRSTPLGDAFRTSLGMRIEESTTEVDYAALAARLNSLAEQPRGTNETLITGDNLVFDYVRRFVRMDGHVRVENDRGKLLAGAVIGRLSESNRVELVEAEKGVLVESKDGKAVAMNASYYVPSGEIRMSGGAKVAKGDNVLSGGTIRFWLKAGRQMICEPEARLVIRNPESLGIDVKTLQDAGGSSQVQPEKSERKKPILVGEMKISADRLVYDEGQQYAQFNGNVKVRDPRVSLDCENLRLHLKEDNNIDWIEAQSKVIIQIDERETAKGSEKHADKATKVIKAMADTAKYFVEEGKFVLEGNPQIGEGPNIMTGERITFWRDEQRMVCEPRARILIYPTEEMRQRFLKDLKE